MKIEEVGHAQHFPNFGQPVCRLQQQAVDQPGVENRRQVHWSQPEVVVIELDRPLAEFGGFHQGGFNIIRADRSFHILSEDNAEDYLRKFMTPSGGDVACDLDSVSDEG